MSLLGLPNELIEQISLSLTSPKDIDALTRACWRLFDIAAPWLYRCGSNPDLLNAKFSDESLQDDDDHDHDYEPPFSDVLRWAIKLRRPDTVRRGISVAPDILNLAHLYDTIVYFDEAITPLVLGREAMRGHLRSSKFPWFAAVMSDSPEALEVMLRLESVDLNQLRYRGQSPLHISAKQGDLKTLRVLIDHGADVETRDDDGMTPLIRAVASDRSEVVRLLIANSADVRVMLTGGETLLHMAVQQASAPLTQVLLEDGAASQVNRVLGNGVSPLILAALRNDHEGPTLTRFLLRHGANVEAKDPSRFDRSALLLAATTGAIETAEELLQWGADPNTVDSLGGTALVRAMKLSSDRKRLEFVRMLLEHGAETERGHISGKTALEWLFIMRSTPTSKAWVDALRLFLKYGVEIGREKAEWIVAEKGSHETGEA